MAQILDLLRQKITNLTQHQNQLQQQQKTIPAVTFRSFQTVILLEFKGSTGPIEARVWLKEIEIFFALMRAEEEQKYEFVRYFPKRETNFW